MKLTIAERRWTVETLRAVDPFITVSEVYGKPNVFRILFPESKRPLLNDIAEGRITPLEAEPARRTIAFR